jgi:hypothetical protein
MIQFEGCCEERKEIEEDDCGIGNEREDMNFHGGSQSPG